MRAAVRYILENSLFLAVGAAAGLAAANLLPDAYQSFLHLRLVENSYFGTAVDGTRVIDVHFLVNDILMALFFAVAGKEVWESLLPGGPLRGGRAAVSPMSATLGGMVGPAVVYVLGAALLGRLPDLGRGWAIPCATDIAFSYLIARFIFGAGHPAIPFLLLLAIADDALGLRALFSLVAGGLAMLAARLLGIERREAGSPS